MGESVTASVFAFNLKQRVPQWTKIADFPANMSQTHHGLACVDDSDFIFSVGGQLGAACGIVSNGVFVLNVVTATFFQIDDIPIPLHGPSVAIHGDHLHVWGGNTFERAWHSHEQFFIEIDLTTGKNKSNWMRSKFQTPTVRFLSFVFCFFF